MFDHFPLNFPYYHEDFHGRVYEPGRYWCCFWIVCVYDIHIYIYTVYIHIYIYYIIYSQMYDTAADNHWVSLWYADHLIKCEEPTWFGISWQFRGIPWNISTQCRQREPQSFGSFVASAALQKHCQQWSVRGLLWETTSKDPVHT